MTVGKFVLYALLVLCVSMALVAGFHAIVRKRMKWWVVLISLVVKFVLCAVFALFAVAITSPLGWNYSPLTVALQLTCLGDAVADLITIVYLLIRRKPPKEVARWILGVLLTLSVMTYGMINMQVVKGKEHTYYSDKLDHEYTFVFIADLHYGSAQMPSVVDKALDEIKALSPDFMLLGGDITDEYTTKEEMEEIYRKIGETGVKTYFIFGNHDRQPKADHAHGATYTEDDLLQTLALNGIEVLRDNFVQFADDLVLLGREDESEGEKRKETEDLSPRPENAYVVNVDHSPYQVDDIYKTGADLQLSGHTHGGQHFPLGFDVGVVKNVYGDYKIGDTQLYVSSGFCGWHDPFRTQNHCRYEIIHLLPANE